MGQSSSSTYDSNQDGLQNVSRDLSSTQIHTNSSHATISNTDEHNLVGVSSQNQALLPTLLTSPTPIPIDTTTNQASDLLEQTIPTTNKTFTINNNINNTLLTNNGTLLADPNEEFSVNLFGNVLYPYRWLTLPVLTSWLGPISSTAMIIGCVLPYLPQYTTIYKTRSCSGFSTFVCLTLLISNILRIAFWFGHRFEYPLLIQSIIQVFAQIALLELCVRVKNQRTNLKKTIWSLDARYFWRWTDLASYLEFIFMFTLLLGISVYFLIDCKLFIETLGYCALVSESMLGLPQVIKNYRKKSVEGMSLSMVLMWLGGDTFKTGYFIANAVPYQFWLCGLLQITIDVVILFQVCLYRQNAPVKTSSSEDESPKEMVSL